MMPELFKILMTDTVDRNLVDLMMVDGLPKLFNDLPEATLFCEDLNRVAREESATWRYEPSLFTAAEQTVLKASLMRDMF